VIVLDASVLIGHLELSDAQHALAVEQLLSAAGQPLGASSITVAEVLVVPARTGCIPDAQAALRALGVHELQLPPDASEQLPVLRAETGLKLPDCCVLLTAQIVGGKVLTLDDRLASEAAQLDLGWEPQDGVA
jgi:predicted nucleic acid-binding protein